jgi:hypothetical protein
MRHDPIRQADIERRLSNMARARRCGVLAAEFLVARSPAENCRPAGHPGIATDGAKAFALFCGPVARDTRPAYRRPFIGLPNADHGGPQFLMSSNVCAGCSGDGYPILKSLVAEDLMVGYAPQSARLSQTA